uniref:Gem-associated protein 2 n=1 Tax=Panagrellus redivivus TaxID=6233 RepID=A0A7E4VT16_PANRE
MDLQLCYDLGDFEPHAVDLKRPATTVKEYLMQVAVNRSNCPDVAFAKLDPTKIKPVTPRIPVPQSSASLTCQWAPDRAWQEAFVKRFTRHRDNIENYRSTFKPLKMGDLPRPSDGPIWRKLCLEKRHTAIPIEPSTLTAFSIHQGTPPTLRFVLSLGDTYIDRLVEHLIKAFDETGYSRALFEWLFAILLVVKTPLQHDVVSTLRSFVRQCRQSRAVLGEADVELIREYTIFIAIVSLYFAQRDLADN